MAAGQGFKTFTTGEVLTAGDVNGYLMQGINVFSSSAARAAAITSPQEGQYSFLKDTNALEYYDGAAWVGAPVGDITAVNAGTGISGGGSSGAVTITNSMATEITASGDIIVGTGSATFDNLPIGTTGQVLTADTTVSPYKVKWATPASSGGMTLLATTTLTGASVTISSLSTYKQLLFVFRGARVASNSRVELRFNGDSADLYSSQEFKAVNTTVSAGGGWVGAGTGLLCRIGDSATTVNLLQGNLVVNATDQTSGVSYFCTAGFNDGTGNTSTLITGRYANSAVISSVTFIAVGTTFSSGTVLTYGVN
jgi:hypothetical protein